MRAPVLLLAAVLTLTGCATSPSDSGPEQVPESQSADPRVLPIGTTDLPLVPRTYYTPIGFVPPLALTVPAGWHSPRRGDDAFELSRPGVTVVFDTPPDATSAAALAAVRAAVKGGTVTPVRGTVAGRPATGFDILGGTGTLLTSPVRTVSVAAAPGRRVRVLGTDLDEVPLLVAVVVPDASRWSRLLPLAQQLLAGVSPG
ncbi:MAG: hypothetical protein JWN55_2701 [Frankiales bacterium]|nr:hypothetical protein [Frankiales bacterium]